MTREEAIAYGKRVIDLGLNDETQAFCELAIKTLEQKPCEDCVSRTELKKWLDMNFSFGGAARKFELFDRLDKELPPVTPQPKTDAINKSNFCQEQYKADLQSAYDCGKASVKPCEDTISRQAAIGALGEKPLAWTEGEYELGLQNQWEHDVDAIRALPPATPKPRTGHWIYDGDQIICSKCHTAFGFISLKLVTNFCAECGADMRGEKE